MFKGPKLRPWFHSSVNRVMQMAVTCRTCLKTRSQTAAWIWRLRARSIPRCQDNINMDIIEVKCDLHSGGVEIDSGGGRL